LRVAGNVLTDLTLAGIEYSVRSFNVPLVLVLGHTHCGAIKTARERKFGIFQSPSTHISTLLDCVEPSLEHELNERAIARNNVIHQMGKVKANSPFVEGLVSQGALKVMGAVYDMETGRVTFMRG
jgi:carbonic anhydrase